LSKPNSYYAVTYQPATAANLTAGSAAWVNGRCILGNGSDNTAFCNKSVSFQKVGSLNGNGSISAIGLTNYADLVSSDFIVVLKGVSYSGGDYIWGASNDRSNSKNRSGSVSGSFSPSLTYTATTGTISVTGLQDSASSTVSQTDISGSAYASVDIYYIK
jgi:hypothetical protein